MMFTLCIFPDVFSCFTVSQRLFLVQNHTPNPWVYITALLQYINVQVHEVHTLFCKTCGLLLAVLSH